MSENKPTYLYMAMDAIRNLKTRGGSSRQAIKKYVDDNHRQYVNSDTLTLYLGKALKKGVEMGYIMQNKQSFKLTDDGKKLLK